MAIYFIADRKNDLVKIGVSNDRDRRLKQLQTGNPFVLELMGWIAEETNQFKIEANIHKEYSNKCFRGEWFSINQNEVLQILALYNGFIPKNDDAFKVIGYDKDNIPEYLGVWDWQDFELEECCPFCGCLCGMHHQKASNMYYCMNCDTLTNFED